MSRDKLTEVEPVIRQHVRVINQLAEEAAGRPVEVAAVVYSLQSPPIMRMNSSVEGQDLNVFAVMLTALSGMSYGELFTPEAREKLKL